MQSDEDDKAVERFKLKKMIRMLKDARGSGTSMVSLILPPKDQISRVNKLLADESGTASNIKSRVNRLSVLSAIVSVQQRLKLYSRVPDSGLLLFAGNIITKEGKEKKLNIDIVPFKPINTSLYMCDSRFHVEALEDLLQDDERYGFIIVDGNGALYGALCGNTREVLHRFTVELPKKHGRGGQSALRFARLRLEKRQNYVRKVAEAAAQVFISDNKCNVAGLIIAGSAEFKQKLASSDVFDGRLSDAVIRLCDISYGGEQGFKQAIELCADSLANIKLVNEKKLLTNYFSEIAQDTGRFCFGVKDVLTAMDLGAAETVIVWEDLPHTRYEMHNPATGEAVVKVLNGDEEKDPKHFHDDAAGVEYEVRDTEIFVEWLAVKYKEFGAKLEFITDRSQEGSQFVKGFGGIGAILRYKVDFDLQIDPGDEDDGGFDDGDDDFF